jgi:hypothetical protein
MRKDMKWSTKNKKCGNCSLLDVFRVDKNLLISPHEINLEKMYSRKGGGHSPVCVWGTGCRSGIVRAFRAQ